MKVGSFVWSQVPGGRNPGEPRARALSKQQTWSGGLAMWRKALKPGPFRWASSGHRVGVAADPRKLRRLPSEVPRFHGAVTNGQRATAPETDAACVARNKALKGEPHERNWHEIRLGCSGRMKAS